MATLYGNEWTRQQLEERTGDLLQVAGVRLMALQEGAEAGLRIADVRTGSGLRFQVSLDRGMDISAAEYRGMPLAWRSPAGDVHPAVEDLRGANPVRTFPGGLMFGCGMTSAGAPSVDDGEECVLHGRLSHLPASNVRHSRIWRGGECVLHVEGDVREYHPFRENLVLHRTIETRLGSSALSIRDQITNLGPRQTPLMMIYHINAGWPVVDEGSRLLLNARDVSPRDAAAQAGQRDATVFGPPVPGFQEQVFYHDLAADPDGYAVALLHNPRLSLGLMVRFRQHELPRFVEWKMTGTGTYVVGMEPANCLTGGRAAERQRGSLRFLEPGAQTEFHVEIGVLDGDETLRACMHTHSLA
jgi:hypothetical protein